MKSAIGKRIVITGVTRGLGLAMAEGFIQHGCVVAGCGRSFAEIESLRKRFGAPHDFAVVNVASDQEVKAWAARLLQSRDTPDFLINNAALMNRSAPLWTISAEEFDPVIDVNIKGVANVIRHFCPAMVAHKHGVIINFSSGWGRSTDSDVAPYCATKWAIEGLTGALALELPQGMAAIPLNPGIINTAMLQSCFGDSAANYPDAEQWAKTAVPFILGLSSKDNGRPLMVP